MRRAFACKITSSLFRCARSPITYSQMGCDSLIRLRCLNGSIRFASLSRDDVDGFFKFMELGARLYEISKETFLRRRPFDPPDKRSLAAIRHMPLRYGWGNYHRTVAAHFKSRHLRQLYDRYPTYVGSSPYQSPATLAVIPYIEYAFGGWYVKGGLYRIIASLVELAARAGVTLLLNAAVERVTRDGKKQPACGWLTARICLLMWS